MTSDRGKHLHCFTRYKDMDFFVTPCDAGVVRGLVPGQWEAVGLEGDKAKIASAEDVIARRTQVQSAMAHTIECWIYSHPLEGMDGDGI